MIDTLTKDRLVYSIQTLNDLYRTTNYFLILSFFVAAVGDVSFHYCSGNFLIFFLILFAFRHSCINCILVIYYTLYSLQYSAVHRSTVRYETIRYRYCTDKKSHLYLHSHTNALKSELW